MASHEDKLQWNLVFHPRNLLLSAIGALLCAFALNQFMVPNHFLDGGVTGVSILLHEKFHWKLWILIPVLNVPFIYMGYLKIGKTFTAQSIIIIVFLVIFLVIIPMDKMTQDKLLVAVFGGFLIGVGMGLCIRAGGVVDGLEIIAVFTTKKIGLTSTEVILYVNSLLFLTAAIEFDIETAMYSIITYYTAIKSIEYVVDGIEEYIALNVISEKSDEVKWLIVNKFEKGITVHRGERGYLPGSFDIKQDCDIIVAILTRLELLSIQQAISDLDPKAFMYVHSIKEAKGGVLKKKVNH